ALPGIGAPEIALGERSEVAEILLVNRTIETELMADLLTHLGGRGAPGNQGDRIGGYHEGETEGDNANAHKDQNRDKEAAREIDEHQPLPRCVGSRASRSPSPTRLNARATIRIAA